MPAVRPATLPLFPLLMLWALPAAAAWTGKGEAGLAFADGNSDTRTANARVTATNKVDDHEFSFGVAGLYVRTDGDTTARRWEAQAQTRANFLGRNFWYGGVRYEEDPFSGFDHQGLVTSGVGRRFIDTERTRLLLQVGGGFKFLERKPQSGAPGRKDDSFTGVSSLEFSHMLTSTTTVFDKASGEFTANNNFVQNEVGVAVKMTTRLALSLAYALRHNTKPPEGFKKTDRLSTVNLVYEVK